MFCDANTDLNSFCPDIKVGVEGPASAKITHPIIKSSPVVGLLLNELQLLISDFIKSF